MSNQQLVMVLEQKSASEIIPRHALSALVMPYVIDSSFLLCVFETGAIKLNSFLYTDMDFYKPFKLTDVNALISISQL